MPTVDINYVAVLLAAVAAMVIGAVWYGVFSKPWMEATGKKKEDTQGAGMAYVLAMVSALVTAYILAHFIAYSGAFYTDVKGAMLGTIVGFWAWLGFVAAHTLMSFAFEGRSWKLWWINNGNQLLTLIVMGIIIATM